MRSTVLTLVVLFTAGSLTAQEGSVTIRAARLLDGKGGSMANPLVTVSGGRIVRVVKAMPGGHATYDLGRLTLMPGLIDVHDHIAWHFTAAGRLHTAGDGETAEQGTLAIAANALATLNAGFTTVQELGNDSDADLRDAIAAGRHCRPSPHHLARSDLRSEA